MRFITKLGLVATVGTAFGMCQGSANYEIMRAQRFNRMQDQRHLEAALMELRLQNVAFYKLKSCPYCAMVGSLLDYAGVPYHEIIVDPITGKGNPAVPYPLVPQLQFMYDPRRHASPLSDSEPLQRGVFLVDSETITRRLLKPLGLEKKNHNFSGPPPGHSETTATKVHVLTGGGAFRNQNEDDELLGVVGPQDEADRQWIRDVFAKASFVAMNGTYTNAYASFPGLVPSRYHGFFSHRLGSFAFWMEAKCRIQPLLVRNLKRYDYLADDEEQRARRREMTDNGTQKEIDGGKKEYGGGKVLHAPAGGDSDRELDLSSSGLYLQHAANQYVRQMVPRGSMFHGGESPDIVDLEMYGVYRSTCMQSSPARLALEKTDIGPWAQEMKKFVPTTKHPVYFG